MSPRRAPKKAPKPQPDPLPPRPGDLLINDPILKTISRAAFALVILFALLLLWRGHNAPGGGFIAGLMTVCALILHRIANGDSALRADPRKVIPWGLALSLGTGLVPYLLGRPFLKSDYGYITTALTGEFEWATALLFDLGVFLVVVGVGLSLAYDLIEVRPTERVEGDG